MTLQEVGFTLLSLVTLAGAFGGVTQRNLTRALLSVVVFFLGIAGLILVSGADMLWYPIGWTGGYLVLMVLVAAPLRRSGAYTLPDFAEARVQSRWVRLVCSLLVVTIGWLYLIPQFQGANLVLGPFMGARPWMAGVVVAGVVLANVLVGGGNSQIALQPVSVQGNVGINVAAGVAQITLRPGV